MENPENPISSKKTQDVFHQVLIVSIIGILFVIIATVLVRTIAPNDNSNINSNEVRNIVNEAIKEKVLVRQPSCQESYQDYLALRNSGSVLVLANNVSSHGEGGDLIGAKDVTVKISGRDDISCGYLYIRASKGSKPLDDKFDSVYINPHDFGGHILRSKAILAENKESFTEVVVPLSSVAYLSELPYNPDSQKFHIADWSKLFNVNDHVNFRIGLSTLDKGGLIEEVSLVYKCWDVETGDETKNCQLGI